MLALLLFSSAALAQQPTPPPSTRLGRSYSYENLPKTPPPPGPKGPSPVTFNNGSKNHWLGISLTGAQSNSQGIGARITVVDSNDRKQFFYVSTAGSYLSASDARIIAGIDATTQVRRVEVSWPSGRSQSLTNPIDRYVSINERDAK